MLKYQAGAGELCHLARLSHCTIMADRTSRDASSAGQQLPCSQQPSSSPHIPPDQLLISSSTVTQKPSSHFWFLEVSPRLKCCAIQQMNLLFSFLSLLSYGFQLNIIEAGSWFAIGSQVLFVDRDRAKVSSLIFLFKQKHFINQNI